MEQSSACQVSRECLVPVGRREVAWVFKEALCSKHLVIHHYLHLRLNRALSEKKRIINEKQTRTIIIFIKYVL